MTLVASALAGGDCIDDADALRTGGTPAWQDNKQLKADKDKWFRQEEDFAKAHFRLHPGLHGQGAIHPGHFPAPASGGATSVNSTG